MTVEHRAAASPRPLIIELAQQGLILALTAVERAKTVAATLHGRISQLAATGRIVKTAAGYSLVEP